MKSSLNDLRTSMKSIKSRSKIAPMSTDQFLKKIENNSPTQNYNFYINDKRAKKHFDKMNFCNCE